ncbi:hypothetical protein MSAN_01803000 [Mycena sanguinolenta]|uniref:MYND-type domain-containing protein n=1 Tax=Mycena sanguinolenta TaxID=230812 RepID=A0A8H6XUR2_9AGAR|nr:hypothetical protein MSAN_01803000 [Mycena sanguinolenta]
MLGTRFGGIEVEHNVHPEIKKYHKSYSTSPKDLREARAQGMQVCAVCGNRAYELRRCGKCKHASYCSRECQKADWPTHKLACSADDSGLNMTKIAQTLNASKFLSTQLQMAFIAAFGLLRDPRLDRPFAAHIDIGIEPTDLMAFVKLHSGDSPGDKAEGMVQVNAFTPLPDVWITKQAAQIWRSAREGATSAGFATSPVGLVVLSKSNALVQMFPIIMLPPMMDYMRTSPTFQRVSSLTGIITVVPVDVDSLMVYVPIPPRFPFPYILALTPMPTRSMNRHIRADNKNKLSLRTEMTPRDVQIIRDAASGNVLATRPVDWPLVAPPPQFAATILKEKIARDPMYKLTVMLK